MDELEKALDELDLEDDNKILDSELIELPFVPLRGLTIFPKTIVNFDIGREKSMKALDEAMNTGKYLFVASQKDDDVLLPTEDDWYQVGTIVRIKQVLKLKGDVSRVLVDGRCRAKITEVTMQEPYLKVRVSKLDEQVDVEKLIETEALTRLVIEVYKEHLSLTDEKIKPEIVEAICSIDDPGLVADTIATQMLLKIEEKQAVLEGLDVNERLNRLYKAIVEENQIVQVEKEISQKVQKAMNKNQKDFFLHEQMKTIQKELGVGEDPGQESLEWLKQLDELHLEEKTDEKIRKEIQRFAKMQPMSAESTVSRTFIETALALPWNKQSKTNSNIKKAEKILNEDHYGLDKVKERIVEYLSVIHLSKEIRGPIICLVGPPGVGKTSVASSIARATGRQFVRMSLGGVRDEAEIRGHRKTYIGAMPGRIISLIKEAGVNNPVFLFDEVDKIGADYKGDPSSALLEVLDPEQNKDFKDHFLEVPFDLSKVMFITTANSVDTIPEPLLDRMEVIEIPGYTEEEKLEIAKRYLIPKKVKEHGLSKNALTFSEKSIRNIINSYTREAGVRNLEREIATIARKTAKKVVTTKTKSVKVMPSSLEGFLGKKKYFYDVVEGKSEVGVVTGMAWTRVGGDTLFIETALMPGSGKVSLTGQLGDVMQESAKAAMSYIRVLGIGGDFYEKKDIHIHVPEGAVPKDGPSAGVTMFTSMVSALTDTPVRKDVAMTGEITLTGKILAVGGIKEKVLAAHRAGVKTIILPKDNKADIDDIPQSVRKELKFVTIEKADEALDIALVK
ncbi:MAG: endopeptidase La [Clostridia bacterium]|nr:endopeptidase La [Clostridia bacterium]